MALTVPTNAWLAAHIIAAVATYGLTTLAAVVVVLLVLRQRTGLRGQRAARLILLAYLLLTLGIQG